MPSTTHADRGQAVTLYAACPVRVIHSDANLWPLPGARRPRSSRPVPRWEVPGHVDEAVLKRALAGLHRL